MFARGLFAVVLAVLAGTAQAQGILGGPDVFVEVRPPPGWTVTLAPALPTLGEARRGAGDARISVAFAVNGVKERQADELIRLFRGIFENQGYRAGPMRSEMIGDKKAIAVSINHPTSPSAGGVYVFTGPVNHLVATVLYAPSQEAAAKPLVRELLEGVRF